MFLVVKCYAFWVEFEDLSELVAHAGLDFLVAAVLEPHLEQSFLCAQRESYTDHLWFFEVLACTIL